MLSLSVIVTERARTAVPPASRCRAASSEGADAQSVRTILHPHNNDFAVCRHAKSDAARFNINSGRLRGIYRVTWNSLPTGVPFARKRWP